MALPVHIFTDSNLQREFQCIICTSCISQCYSTSCGHLYCCKCIIKHVGDIFPAPSSDSSTDSDNEQVHEKVKSRGQCPACQRILQVGDIFPAPYVDQKINEQIIRCCYFNKGCVWTGTVSDLKRKNGHLKQCPFTLYKCKYCKQNIIRNQMVKHQNEECKSNFMLCPYYIYGCSFECRIREMEKHCQINELKHVKLKLDYLENQLFVPEIIKLNGMSGFNNQYIESNGKYYLINKSNKNNNIKNKNNKSYALKPITYKKNGGYTLEFNQTESIWHLRSLYYGLIAYGINNNNNNKNNILINNNCIWNVYYKHGDKNSLIIDKNVNIQSILLSNNMTKWSINDQTDTEEINGEFDIYDNNNNIFDMNNKEGYIINKPNKLNKKSNWYNIIFGTYFGIHQKKKGKEISNKLELIGMITLSGVLIYYLWSKFLRSNSVSTVAVLKTLKPKPSNMLMPKLNWS